MNKKDNIFYFFLIALALHLSLFIVNERGVKGDAPLSLKTNSAPISVKIKSPVVKKAVVKKRLLHQLHLRRKKARA